MRKSTKHEAPHFYVMLLNKRRSRAGIEMQRPRKHYALGAINMNPKDFVTLEQFNELLVLFRQTLKHDLHESADEILTFARETIDNLSRNQALIQPLTENPEAVKELTANLLKYFHAVAERRQSNKENEDGGVARRDNEIRLMWRLWPVLHRLLVLQSNVDFDHEDYNQKAAELYGVIAQFMESRRAVQLLKECIDQVLPLPGA